MIQKPKENHSSHDLIRLIIFCFPLTFILVTFLPIPSIKGNFFLLYFGTLFMLLGGFAASFKIKLKNPLSIQLVGLPIFISSLFVYLTSDAKTIPTIIIFTGSFMVGIISPQYKQ